MKSIAFCLIFVTSIKSQANFVRGDNFQYVNISGELTIQCQNRTKTVMCSDTFMDPWPYDVFAGPQNGKAQLVELKATVGSNTQTATVDYDGKSGKSKDINLGVNSLFQKSLLKIGENTVRFALLEKNNNSLETGLFKVFVTRGSSRSCEPGETETQNTDDCDYPYTLCQIYFKSQNYCLEK